MTASLLLRLPPRAWRGAASRLRSSCGGPPLSLDPIHSHPAPCLPYPERLTPGDPSLGGLEPPCIPCPAPWVSGGTCCALRDDPRHPPG